MERCCQPGCEHGETAGALRLRLHLPEQGPRHNTQLYVDTNCFIYIMPGSGLPRGLGHSRLPRPHRPRSPREEGAEESHGHLIS